MIRKIIKIDEEKCNGCGLCVDACHEGAIGMINGKAKLLRDDYCDGLGDCLPVCEAGAITFEEREAEDYNEEAVKENKLDRLPCGCPGTNSKRIERDNEHCNATQVETQLNQWPVQIKLVSPLAPYFDKADLLVAADCTAYAYGNFHSDYIRNKICIIGCTKLDDGDYSEKLTDILKRNDIKSVTVARMEVPCCGGIEHCVKTAINNSGKAIPLKVITISTDGKIL